MTYRKDNRINNCEPTKVWFWSLILVIIICLFSYGYLVRGTIVNIVARQNMEDNLSALNSKVLALESEYIKAKNSVTEEMAYNLGFIPSLNQKFVVRNANPGLSLLTSGR